MAATRDRLIARVAKIAALYDDTIAELTTHELTPRDADLITPARAHIQLAINNLDNALFEVDQHGHSYPNGRPRLRLAGDAPHNQELADAA